MKLPSIEITIPVLNEEASLEKQIKELFFFMNENYNSKASWSIVIADNGSEDDTVAIANTLQASYDEIRVVSVPARGVGLALKTSWGRSTADYVGYMDLDLATDLTHFHQAFSALVTHDYDLVYATRLHPNSKIIGRSMKREVTSRVFNFIVKAWLGTRFSDGMCGFKFLKRSIFPELMKGGAVSDGWFFSTELLTVAEWKNYRIFELPVRWTDDTSSSRVRILPLAKQYLKAMAVLKNKKPA
jgi:glycosyltransferase involved in cell wall biosynthesis